MRKRISPDRLRAQIIAGYSGLKLALDRWLANQEEDREGVLIDSEAVTAHLRAMIDDTLIPWLNSYVAGHMGPITEEDLEPVPEPPEDFEPEYPQPEPQGIRVNRTGKISINQKWRDRFVFPKLGPEYGQHLTFKWSDGVVFDVPDSRKRWQPGGDLADKYQPGGTYSYQPADQKIPTMEVYRAFGKSAEWVELMAEGAVEEPPEKPEGGWKRIYFGGDKSLGTYGHDDRDRTWWTELHSEVPGKPREWVRKFLLGGKLDDTLVAIDFRFSDGTTFFVPNSQKMAMNPDGPKYRPGDPNERDPRKQGCKIGAVVGSKPDWVEYKVR